MAVGLSVALLIVWLVGVRWAQTLGIPSLLPSEGSSPASPAPTEEKAAWAPVSAEDAVVDRFMRLRNAGDPAASTLLGPKSAFPDHPVSEDDAERLQADHFLREGLRITAIQRQEYGEAGVSPLPPGHYLLVTEGNVAAPTLTVLMARGLERSQRTMSNPDVLVAVRGGRVVGLRAELHREPPRPSDHPNLSSLFPGTLRK